VNYWVTGSIKVNYFFFIKKCHFILKTIDDSLFDSVVVFQIIFRAEIYINNVFLFFKNYFQHQHIKTIQNILNFNKKKFLNFLKTRFAPRFQTVILIGHQPCLILF
jgi:hypothetical protein